MGAIGSTVDDERVLELLGALESDPSERVREVAAEAIRKVTADLIARGVFLEAIKERSPDEWPKFLDEACGGRTRLRDRVQKMLDVCSEDGSNTALVPRT